MPSNMIAKTTVYGNETMQDAPHRYMGKSYGMTFFMGNEPVLMTFFKSPSIMQTNITNTAYMKLYFLC